MNIKRAKEEIKNTIRAYLAKNSYGEYEIPVMGQRPVLLMGPPGIGKTQIMEQVARECGIGLVAYTITHHTRQSAIGLPFIAEQTYGEKAVSVTQYTMSEIVAAIYNKMEETGLKEGILFIDEINCVSETLAPAMLQFLQYKTFGNHKIPDGWIIAAAGNPPEFNKSVREFDIATLDRVKRIRVEPDFSVWKEYAVRMEVHPAILSYLTARPQNFCQVETTVDGPVFATPRGWEDLSRFLTVYEKLGLSCDREVVAQYIPHGRIARDFASYLELYYKYQAQYQIDQALSGHRSEALLEQAARAPFDEKLSVISLVLAKLNVEFRKTGKMEDGLELLFEKLKEFKGWLAENGDGAPVRRLTAFVGEVREEFEEKKQAGLLTRAQIHRYEDVCGTLGWYLLEAGETEGQDGEALFGMLASRFGTERERYEEQCRAALKMVEYAFDFMEGAFGDSQEMVIFITELNTSYDAVRFLEENPCERYYQYNRKLLFEDREAELKKKLDRLL
ncbi:MAG: ATP-binding protein [Sakamotonia sp.]|jgi:DNA polymerase III delta prime subunit